MQVVAQSEPTAYYRDRATEAVLAAAHRLLHATGHYALRAIACEMEGDTLIMVGKVQTFYQKQLAQAALLNQPGIPAISNRIHVAARG